MRRRLFEIIEKGQKGDRLSTVYDIVMLFAIVVSIIPLMFFEELKWFKYVEIVTVVIFVIDYLLRWITADFKM